MSFCCAEAFPEGGLFRGKNFVYDPRRAVAASLAPAALCIVGQCAVCTAPWDDYSAEPRCALCRVLLLVCDACRTGGAGGGVGAWRCEQCVAQHGCI